MNKNILFVLLALLLVTCSTVAFAINGCVDDVAVNTPCYVRTPPISCNTYDIIKPDGTYSVQGQTMQESPSGSGLYNFTFTGTTNGVHTVQLCDNSTLHISVQTYSTYSFLDAILTIVQWIEQLI